MTPIGVVVALTTLIVGFIVGMWLTNLAHAIDAQQAAKPKVPEPITVSALSGLVDSVSKDKALYTADRKPITGFHLGRYEGQQCIFLETTGEPVIHGAYHSVN